MGNVIFNMSVSLDGFVAGPKGEVDQLFKWYFNGDTEMPIQEGRIVLKVSKKSAAYLQETWPTIGAMVTGRKNFDSARAWGGNPPLGVHHFVVTHKPPKEWVKEGSPFTFVTEGVEEAVKQAKRVAGDKRVAISTANVMQQALEAGLLDELHLDVVPVLLGNGVRLFGEQTADLECLRLVEAPGVTHMQFRVVR